MDVGGAYFPALYPKLYPAIKILASMQASQIANESQDGSQGNIFSMKAIASAERGGLGSSIATPCP